MMYLNSKEKNVCVTNMQFLVNFTAQLHIHWKCLQPVA